MKVLETDLNDVVVSSYDKTKTSIFGRVSQRTINSELVLGPPLNGYMDTFTDAAVTPGVGIHCTQNERMFVLQAPSGGLALIALYTFNTTTGAKSYVGKIQVTLPNTAATTHTIRGLKVYDSGTTGWKIFIETIGSVLINGGVFMVNSIALSDFVPVGFPVIPLATSNNAKAVYFLQDPANIGVNQLQTASCELVMDYANQKIYGHNGVAATHQFYVYDFSVAPTVAPQTFTITIASPGVVTATAHGYNNNDQVVLSTTGALPTGLVAGTVYFVRNAAANTFELSGTSGGASINTTGTQSGVHTVMRAFGITGDLFSFKTGNLPALTGTIILTGSGYYANPTDCPAAPSLVGQDCIFMATSTNFYLGKMSDLSAGSSLWASLATVNILGGTNEFTAPTTAQAMWSDTLSSVIYTTNTSTFIVKKFENNIVTGLLGGLDTQYLEGVPGTTPNFGAVTIAGIDTRNGWIFLGGSTVGQRVIIFTDLYSDTNYGYSRIISKVIKSNKAVFQHLSTIEELYDISSTTTFYYRTAPAGDAMFNSDSGGWVAISQATDLSAITLDDEVQIKVDGWDIVAGISVTPAQIHELNLAVTPQSELSDNWVGSVDNTSTGSPSRSAFRLITAYTSVVPKLYFRAYNDSGVLVASANTVDNPSMFEYSANNGSSWNALGTIPNTILTTELRYNWASPPGVRVTVGIREV